MNPATVYDVLVIGGGLAGIAAALESARMGLKTALIEKTILWGGLATSGLVPIYMALCDGDGRQVTFGIAEELLALSIKYGPGRIPSGWPNRDERRDSCPPDSFFGRLYAELYPDGRLARRYLTAFSPIAFALALDEVLEGSDIDLWLDTLACVPIMSGDKVVGVEVENKSGRIAIGASCVIDASGDGDVAFRAGAPCEENKSHPTFLLQYTSLGRARQAVERESAEGLVTHWTGGATEMGEYDCDAEEKCSPTDGRDITRFVMHSRRLAREAIARQHDAMGPRGRDDLYPVSLPTMPQFRMTRKIVGHESVEPEQRNRHCPTSVGCIADCRKTGDVWEVPYGSLLPQGIENLIVAGRCVSAEGYAWQVTRLIPAAALTGQIAGIAAALAIRGKTSPHKLDVRDVQSAAAQRGILLHI